MRIVYTCLVVLLSGCSSSELVGQDPVVVNGVGYFVAPMPNEPGSWFAHLDKSTPSTIFSVSPQSYANNILAIEKKTGCKVDTRSVHTFDGGTWAKVDCQ